MSFVESFRRHLLDKSGFSVERFAVLIRIPTALAILVRCTLVIAVVIVSLPGGVCVFTNGLGVDHHHHVVGSGERHVSVVTQFCSHDHEDQSAMHEPPPVPCRDTESDDSESTEFTASSKRISTHPPAPIDLDTPLFAFDDRVEYVDRPVSVRALGIATRGSPPGYSLHRLFCRYLI